MPVFGRRRLFSVWVGFWGLNEPDEVPFQAAVRHEKPPTLPESGRSALAPLIPLTAIRVLHASGAETYFLDDMMELVAEAASFALESEEAARELTIRELAANRPTFYEQELTDVAMLDQPAAFLKGVPVVVPALPGKPEQEFGAELRTGPRGYWAKIRAPRRGPAFFSAFGLNALIEQTANNAPYDEIIVPAMAALVALERKWDEYTDASWATVEGMAALQTAATEVALASEPRRMASLDRSD